MKFVESFDRVLATKNTKDTKHANNAGHRLDDCAVIQGHPDMWNDASFAAFKKIVDQLLADGWEFVTPRDFATTP